MTKLKFVAVAGSVSAFAVAASPALAVDVTAAVTEIGTAGTAIVAVGGAIFAIAGTIMAIRMVRRMMGA